MAYFDKYLRRVTVVLEGIFRHLCHLLKHDFKDIKH